MAADDDTTRFEDWDRVANGKIGIRFRWHRVADANLTIDWNRLGIGLQILKLAKILGCIGCF
jgi:hypothetical protein